MFVTMLSQQSILSILSVVSLSLIILQGCSSVAKNSDKFSFLTDIDH